MYTREYMAGHSVTGQSSSSCTEGKPGLAKQDLVEITSRYIEMRKDVG
jgi:hypothetical protein